MSNDAVLKKIEKARNEKAKILDLSHMELSALPPEIQHLTSLQRLSVYNTQLSALPPEIQHLTRAFQV